MPFHVVVMAGGSGTHFWPLSRRRRPKQVLALAGERPLITETLTRVAPMDAALWVCCGTDLEEVIRSAVGDDADYRFVLEPEPRNTTACVALAVARVLAQTGDPETVVAFLPADHAIEPAEGFRRVLGAGVAHASSHEGLLVIGIDPTGPHEGYGYIEHGETTATVDGLAIERVASFHEKPEEEEAAAWIATGRYSWNGGFVVGRIRAFLDTFHAHARAVHDATLAMRDAYGRDDEEGVHDAFRSLEAVAFDYAVLEKSPTVDVVRADFEWDDLGSFAALAERIPKDEDGNRTDLGAGLATILHGCRDTFVVGHGEHLVAGLGLEGLVVVHTDDATLVCPRDKLEKLRKLVAEIKSVGREDVL